MKIAVTGASGRIGNLVVRKLLDAGNEVRVLQRSQSPALEGLNIERVQGELFDLAALAQLTKDCEVLIHLAALISIEGDLGGKVYQVNVQGTRNVLETALVAGVRRVVYFSSIHAFTELPKEGVFDETRPLAFQSRMAYDRSKAEAMRFAQNFAAQNKIEIVALCPTGVIGPFDFGPSLSGQFLLDLYYQNIPLLVPGGFDWCDVRDVADTAVFSLNRGRSGEAYLLSGHYATLEQLAEIVHKITGKLTPKIIVPNWLLRLGQPFVTAFGKISGNPPLYTSEALDTLRDGSRYILSEKAMMEWGCFGLAWASTGTQTISSFVCANQTQQGMLFLKVACSNG